MSDFFAAANGSTHAPLDVLFRLIVAMLLGGVVTLIYRRTRYATPMTSSFSVTLVLLTVLIAMVTQVIGDNVARAFSLVGALSIVRFRTVVRDTQDTAYVIFAVAVGMAVGAAHPWLALDAIAVIGLAAFVMRERTPRPVIAAHDPYILQVRIGLGHDPNALLSGTLDTYLRERRVQGVSTARQGLAIEVSYKAVLRTEESAAEMVQALNRIDGVQSVSLQREGIELE
jgi:uncharacterized membrane protein YhiD involved in acid resistance